MSDEERNARLVEIDAEIHLLNEDARRMVSDWLMIAERDDPDDVALDAEEDAARAWGDFMPAEFMFDCGRRARAEDADLFLPIMMTGCDLINLCARRRVEPELITEIGRRVGLEPTDRAGVDAHWLTLQTQLEEARETSAALARKYRAASWWIPKGHHRRRIAKGIDPFRHGAPDDPTEDEALKARRIDEAEKAMGRAWDERDLASYAHARRERCQAEGMDEDETFSDLARASNRFEEMAELAETARRNGGRNEGKPAIERRNQGGIDQGDPRGDRIRRH